MTKRIRRRVPLEWGWAETDEAVHKVRIGDRFVPPSIDVHFAGVDGQPALDMRLAVIDGIPQCRELCLRSADDGREVKALDLNAIRLGNWVEDIFGMFADRIVSDDGRTITAVIVVGDDVDAAREMHKARKGRAARRITPAFLEQVAAVYEANIDGAPTQAVKRQFGVEDRQARKYVKLAEEAGHLLPTSPGRKRRVADGKR